jgi:SAM-dependent methyltransferase
MSEYKKRVACACCGNTSLKNVISFGEVPLAGNFPKKEELSDVKKYELSLMFCETCALLQTDSIIDSDTLFKDYRYMSSIGLTNHFTNVANLYKNRFNLGDNSKVLEIGSNDGVLLKPLNDLGINALGVEPATNIHEVAKSRGCNSINDYFGVDFAKKHFKQGQFDLIVANNCFAHIDDIHSIVNGVKYCLSDNGHFVIEVHYLKNLIEGFQFDFIYHEHLYYYSLNSLSNLLNKHGMIVVDFEEISIHSGSIRVYAKKNGIIPEKVTTRLMQEVEIGRAHV